MSVNLSYAQTINGGVDTLEKDVKSAIDFYRSYIQAMRHKDSIDYSKYWSADDCKKYKLPDQIYHIITSDGSSYIMGKPTIIYIKPSKDYIHIKTLFADADSLGNSTVYLITNHYIKFDKNNKPFFGSSLDINGANWASKTVRNVTFHFPKIHEFNPKKADSLLTKIEKLEKDWGLIPINIQYYFADTKEEIDALRGCDYDIGLGNRDKPSGMSDDLDNMVFCAGWGENFFHEIVHLYLNHLYPKSPLKEGIAVYYGGSLGHELSWHIPRLNKYLNDHKEIDLSKDDFWYMDNYTNPWSTIKGMLCLMVYKKDGINGLKRIMTYKSLDEILDKEFLVKSNDMNAFLRKAIAEE